MAPVPKPTLALFAVVVFAAAIFALVALALVGAISA
jgi:hypothetical protein